MFELHGLQRLLYEGLTVAEAQALMRIPAVRRPGEPLESLEFRGSQFNRHEDNRVLIHNEWGITDVHVAKRQYLVTMLLTAEDLATLTDEETPNA